MKYAAFIVCLSMANYIAQFDFDGRVPEITVTMVRDFNLRKYSMDIENALRALPSHDL